MKERSHLIVRSVTRIFQGKISDVIFPGFSNLPVNGKLPVNCHNLPVNYQEFLKRAVDHVN